MTKSPLYIEITQPADRAAILAISTEVGVFSPTEIATVDELLGEYFGRGAEVSGYYFLSCFAGVQLVGFACYGPRPLTQGTFDLYWIASDKSCQGQGIGSAMLERVHQDIKTIGGRLVIVETSGQAIYQPTCQFYEKNHYQREATITDFYAPGDSLFIYIYRL